MTMHGNNILVKENCLKMIKILRKIISIPLFATTKQEN